MTRPRGLLYARVLLYYTPARRRSRGKIITPPGRAAAIYTYVRLPVTRYIIPEIIPRVFSPRDQQLVSTGNQSPILRGRRHAETTEKLACSVTAAAAYFTRRLTTTAGGNRAVKKKLLVVGR